MDTIISCSRWVSSLFCEGSPAPSKETPPPLPKAKEGLDRIHEVQKAHLAFLAGRLDASTHSVFPDRERRELFKLQQELERHQCTASLSRLCCWLPAAGRSALPTDEEMERSPWIEACCTSREGRWAMLVGYIFGCGSGLVATYLCVNSTLIATMVGGILSGFANCGGTYFTLVDSAKRMKALDRKQDLHEVFHRFFNELALYLLEEHESAIARPTYVPGTPTPVTHIVEEILTNEDHIHASLYEFFSEAEEREYNQGSIFDQLFQVCRYIRWNNPEQLTELILRNHLKTLRSVDRRELGEAKETISRLERENRELNIRQERLEGMVGRLETRLIALESRATISDEAAAIDEKRLLETWPPLAARSDSAGVVHRVASRSVLGLGGSPIPRLPPPPISSGRRMIPAATAAVAASVDDE